MPVRFAAVRTALALALAVLPIAAAAQTNTFDLLLEDKVVGKDVYTIDKDKKGYRVKSRITVHQGAADIDLSGDYQFDENYGYKSLEITSHTQNLKMYFLANKDQTSLEMIIQGAAQATNTVPTFTNLMLLTPFDPAAAQAVLLQAVTHPTKDDLYGVFVPALAGGGGARRGAAPGDPATIATEPDGVPYHAKWLKGKDTGGMLAGKPIVLHTYLLGYGRARYYFYADDTNQLMMVKIPGAKTTYTRTNFQLAAGPVPVQAK